MEGKKQMGSSSSLTSELFGSNESHPPPASGIFESMFSPSSKVCGVFISDAHFLMCFVWFDFVKSNSISFFFCFSAFHG